MGTLGRNALTIGAAAALLTGCGGSQPPIAAQGAMPENRAIGPATYPRNRTFNYTGREQDFRVPFSVTKIEVVVRGAAGGYGARGSSILAYGGRVFAIIPVAPGETLAVFVGGQPSGATGGFNGGGRSGSQSQGYSNGFGGGGASDIREGGDRLIDRIVVAGGGGGNGGPFYLDDGVGGKGGGSTGGTGSSGGASSGLGGLGGTGGTQNRGGLGGRGGASSYAMPGTNGSIGRGGQGGEGCQNTGFCNHYGGNGGGGGGGYYGGGGGGGGAGGWTETWAGGGGGGGSSYIEPSAKKFQSWQGWKNATTNGLVVISW